jgi:hypothetical protein
LERHELVDFRGVAPRCRYNGRHATLLEVEGPLKAPKRISKLENGIRTDYPFDFARTTGLVRFDDGSEAKVPFTQITDIE